VCGATHPQWQRQARAKAHPNRGNTVAPRDARALWPMTQALKHEPGTIITSTGALATVSGESTRPSSSCCRSGLDWLLIMARHTTGFLASPLPGQTCAGASPGRLLQTPPRTRSRCWGREPELLAARSHPLSTYAEGPHLVPLAALHADSAACRRNRHTPRPAQQ
jgi:hypothetical protein